LTKYLHDLSRKYLKTNNASFVNDKKIKLSKYVVYFLHVQPERSIDVMSPNYINQIEIIKQLRRSLPWNIDLLVKDHPASDGAQSFSFYSDLKKIHGVRLISRQVDSREISINSIAVATVSGTVAYEMALLNKPAIMFSKIFFSVLPSIYLYKTPDLLANHFRKLLTSHIGELEPNDNKILAYLKNLYKNSVASDWDGYYGFLQRKTLLSITELILKVIVTK
jgi:lipid A disaccharide synthetase